MKPTEEERTYPAMIKNNPDLQIPFFHRKKFLYNISVVMYLNGPPDSLAYRVGCVSRQAD